MVIFSLFPEEGCLTDGKWIKYPSYYTLIIQSLLMKAGLTVHGITYTMAGVCTVIFFIIITDLCAELRPNFLLKAVKSCHIRGSWD